jgi:hypothetical protein
MLVRAYWHENPRNDSKRSAKCLRAAPSKSVCPLQKRLKLTPQYRTFHEKLIVTHLIKKFLALWEASLAPFLCPINPLHTFIPCFCKGHFSIIPYFCKDHFSIILLFTRASLKWSICLRFFYQNLVLISHTPPLCVTCIFHLIFLHNYPSNIR